jgi:hypothetical protein
MTAEQEGPWHAWQQEKTGKWFVVAYGYQESWAAVGKEWAEYMAVQFNMALNLSAKFDSMAAEVAQVRQALDDLTKHFHPTDGTRFPSPKECSDCKLRAKFNLPPMFRDEDFPGHAEALKEKPQ